jgi:pimeloyl-ACP methyl ester carboxylesterase
MAISTIRAGYAPVNGLNMYYEIHGVGEPLLLLHGAFMTVEGFGSLLPSLAETRQVIVTEMQAHGRTADIDRPLSVEHLADDAAALIRHLGHDRVDVFGYSLGAGVALHLAVRHPDVVRNLILASGNYSVDGFHPGVLDGIQTITPEMFAGSPMEDTYLKVAPNPQDWPILIEKIKQLDRNLLDVAPEAVHALSTPTLLIVGDSDIVRPEHAVEMFRLLGGGVVGDFAGLPQSRLAILPGTTHISLIDRTDLLLPMIQDFLVASSRAGS